MLSWSLLFLLAQQTGEPSVPPQEGGAPDEGAADPGTTIVAAPEPALEPALEQDVVTTAPSETLVRAPRAEASTVTSPTAIVVTGDELVRTGRRSLPRALGEASGVWIQETNLGGGAPVLRGLLGNEILIVVDGVRMNDSTTRTGPNQSLNNIDPGSVDRIEVIRGPSSVLYGSDALGGVILVWTKTGRGASGGRPFAYELDAEYRDVADGGRAWGSLAGTFGDHSWFLEGGLQDWDDLEAADGEVQEFTGYDGNSWFGSWESVVAPRRTLRATASRNRDFDVPRTDRLVPGFGQTQPSNSEFDFVLQDRQRYILSYTDQNAGLLADQLQTRFSFRHYVEERRIRAFEDTTRRLERDSTDTFGVGVDLRKALGDDHLITYGLDVDFDQVDSGRNDVDINSGATTPAAGRFAPNSQYLSMGVFVQDEIFSFEPFELTAGLRYSYFDFGFDDFTTGEDVDGDFDQVTGSLQLARDFSPGVRTTATLAQGFRAPNLSELARNATFFGGELLANPDLEPVESLYAELALELTRELWNASFAVYYHELSDTIGRVLLDPGGPEPGDETYMSENLGELTLQGVEARFYHRLGGASSPWSAEVLAEYTRGEQDDDFTDPNTGEMPFDDVPARRIPPAHGTLFLRYEPFENVRFFDRGELSIITALEQDRLNPEDVLDPRIDPNGTDAWTTVNLSFAGPLGSPASGARWRLGLHNLFDEAYRVHGSGIDGPGFGLTLGLHVSR